MFTLALIAGATLRIVPYLADRSLWLDEAQLALNITHRGYLGLTRPLDAGQAAPVGFLVLERLVVDLWDDSERALRLLPLLAALGSLALFAALAHSMLVEPAAPIALGLFALSPPLAYYASEVKQYSTDVLVCLALLLLSETIGFESIGPRALGTLVAAGSLSVWLSHPAVFVCAGIASTLVAVAHREGRRRDAVRLVGVGGAWLLSFTLDYVLILRHADSDGYLARFWQRGFLPLPPRDAAELLWLPRTLIGLFADPVGLTFSGVAAVCFVVGCLSLARSAPRRLALLLAPAGFALLAAALRLHPLPTSGNAEEQPLLGRVILFIVPPILILIAAGIGSLVSSSANAAVTAGVCLGLLLLLPLAWEVPGRLAEPVSVNEVRPLVEKLFRRARPGSIIVVNEKGRPILHYYMDRLRGRTPALDALRVVELKGKGDRAHIRRAIESLEPGASVFLLYAHHPSWRSEPDEEFALELLEERGTHVFTSHKRGAALHLFNLEDSAEASRG